MRLQAHSKRTRQDARPCRSHAAARMRACPGCVRGRLRPGPTGLERRVMATSAAFAHPRASKAADKEKETDQSSKHRQYADAAYHACLANAQSKPVLALEGIARTYRENTRQM